MAARRQLCSLPNPGLGLTARTAAAIEELPPRCPEVFVLCKNDGFSGVGTVIDQRFPTETSSAASLCHRPPGQVLSLRLEQSWGFPDLDREAVALPRRPSLYPRIPQTSRVMAIGLIDKWPRALQTR